MFHRPRQQAIQQAGMAIFPCAAGLCSCSCGETVVIFDMCRDMSNILQPYEISQNQLIRRPLISSVTGRGLVTQGRVPRNPVAFASVLYPRRFLAVEMAVPQLEESSQMEAPTGGKSQSQDQGPSQALPPRCFQPAPVDSAL